MKRFVLMCVTSGLAIAGEPTFGQDAQGAKPQEFWAGTNPVVWSLRAGTYSGRQASVSPGISARQEIAASKPVVWSLRSGNGAAGSADA